MTPEIMNRGCVIDKSNVPATLKRNTIERQPDTGDQYAPQEIRVQESVQAEHPR